MGFGFPKEEREGARGRLNRRISSCPNPPTCAIYWVVVRGPPSTTKEMTRARHRRLVHGGAQAGGRGAPGRRQRPDRQRELIERRGCQAPYPFGSTRAQHGRSRRRARQSRPSSATIRPRTHVLLTPAAVSAFIMALDSRQSSTCRPRPGGWMARHREHGANVDATIGDVAVGRRRLGGHRQPGTARAPERRPGDQGARRRGRLPFALPARPPRLASGRRPNQRHRDGGATARPVVLRQDRGRRRVGAQRSAATT